MLENRKTTWIAVIILTATVLAACNGAPNQVQPEEPSTDPVEPGQPPAEPVSPDDSVSIDNPDNSDGPVSSNDPAAEPTPTRIAGDVVEGEAIVNSFEVLVLESFPVQISLAVRGDLPDGCTTINESTSTRSGNMFTVTITTVRPADALCTEALVPFEENIGLDVFGLAAGTYTVNVNDITGSFTLDVDNVPQEDPLADTGTVQGPYSDLATITDFDVQVSTAPQAVNVVIRGTILDGCIGFLEVGEQRNGNAFQLTVGRNVPEGTICTQAITAFELTHTLQSTVESGTYTLNINDAGGQFNVQ